MYNENNLRALAKFLREVAKAEQFNMRNYANNPKINGTRGDTMDPVQVKAEHRCGTVACAIGHAPYLFPGQPNEGWESYSNRVFGISFTSPAWDWLFHSEWADIDNTKEGAAARIDWLLDHGLPDDYRDQMMGYEDLCYV